MGDDYEGPVKIQGYLEKKFRLRVCSWWRKYWFVLEGKTLLCFKNKEESDIYFQKQNSRKAFVSFTNVHAVRRVHTSNTSRFIFEIVTKGPVFYLAANEEETCKKWIEALQNALQLPNISSPLKNESFRKQSNSSLLCAVGLPARQDYSLSQPNLRNLVERKESAESFESDKAHSLCFYSPEIVVEEVSKRPHLLESEFSTENSEHALGVEHLDDESIVFLRNKSRSMGQYLTVMRDTHVWRNTASEFFLSEQNRDWPGLSLDLYDEVLDEIMLQHKEVQPKLQMLKRPRTLPDDMLTDKNTQTDFPDDDQLLYLEQVEEARNELISYLSSTTLNRLTVDPQHAVPMPETWRASDLDSDFENSVPLNF